jgi:hypothetical protein
MKYESEAAVMEALGIENWRNLSKENFLRFAAMMPEISSEVSLSLIKQFPVFKDFALETLNKLESIHSQTLDANVKSEEHIHAAFADVRRVLQDELNKEDLAPEEKANILKMIFETASRQAAQDEAGKKFLKEIFTTSVTVIGLTVMAALVFVGSKAAVENGNR